MSPHAEVSPSAEVSYRAESVPLRRSVPPLRATPTQAKVCPQSVPNYSYTLLASKTSNKLNTIASNTFTTELHTRTEFSGPLQAPEGLVIQP